ncbi:MAG TPA: hypothetical protein VG942_08005 [Hyphomonadaceae bacterium]|nr:hypothetical protein [Hyphomonadaceae bacterium]
MIGKGMAAVLGLLMLVAAQAPALAQSACTPLDPAACQPSNPALANIDIGRNILAFLGKEPGLLASYPTAKPPVDQWKARDDVFEILAGPADAPVMLDKGLMMLTACRAHSCGEKAAMVLKPNGDVAAIALLAIRYTNPALREDQQVYQPSKLLVFVAKAEKAGASVPAITAWAQRMYDAARAGQLIKNKLEPAEIRVR